MCLLMCETRELGIGEGHLWKLIFLFNRRNSCARPRKCKKALIDALKLLQSVLARVFIYDPTGL